MTDQYRKQDRKIRSALLPLIVSLVLLYAVLNGFTTYLFYEDYKCKMNLLTEIAVHTEDSGLDMAVDWLKGKDHHADEQGKQLLEQYGYGENKSNAFYRSFLKNVFMMNCISAVATIFIFFLLYRWKKRGMKELQNTLKQLEQILVRFRESDFEAAWETEPDDAQEKIKFQLEAIGHHIQLLKEEARAEKESTKEMVSDISHQLKTPVAALDTCFSVLLRENLSVAEQQEFRIRCRSALDGLEKLLQSLLQISKMEAGLIQIEKERHLLMDTVISAVNCVYPKADEKQIEFIFDCEEGMEDCAVMQDKKWLGEALINVIDNAVKYSPANSKIVIRMQKRAGFVRLEIEDQGIGIPKNEYHKIFQRFYRGTSVEVKEKSGSGIGLFLSREIIEWHGGTITASSDKGKKGSVFVIQLPDEIDTVS